jgi:hypothetical protein
MGIWIVPTVCTTVSVAGDGIWTVLIVCTTVSELAREGLYRLLCPLGQL